MDIMQIIENVVRILRAEAELKGLNADHLTAERLAEGGGGQMIALMLARGDPETTIYTIASHDCAQCPVYDTCRSEHKIKRGGA